ncbi:STAS domain-containing protein [Rugamonas apoptosis]|nr:STAS domain-containing protein [Rugamonas apoptosis]
MPQQVIVLDGELTIQYAGSVKPLLAQAFSSAAPAAPVLDLSGVTDMDGAGLQLLLAFAQAVARAGGQLTLQGVPAVVAAVLERYRVADQFAGVAP